MGFQFTDPVVGGTILRRPAIRSPNYALGSAGWTIDQDGSAEFNNLTIRGQFLGLDYEINTKGAFFYSSAPALGNLVASTAAIGGSDDGHGNQFLEGVRTYNPDGLGGVSGYSGLTGGEVQIGGNTLATLRGMLESVSIADIALRNVTGGESLQILGRAAGGAMLTTGVFTLPDPASGNPETWHDLSVTLAGWATSIGGYPAQYRLLPSGDAMIIGDISGPAIAASPVVLGTVPAAYHGSIFSPPSPIVRVNGALTATDDPFMQVSNTGAVRLTDCQGATRIGFAVVIPLTGNTV